MTVVVPNALALASIADGSAIVASDHRNNYAAVQVGVNGLIAMFTAAPTKGDLVVSAGAGSFDKLAVGSNGQVITADSTQTLGVKWATPSSGITGRITSAGAITAGTGFTCVRNSAGNYTVTFTASFAAVPVVLCTSVATAEIADLNSVAVGSFNVIFFTTGAVATDTAFNFLAVATV